MIIYFSVSHKVSFETFIFLDIVGKKNISSCFRIHGGSFPSSIILTIFTFFSCYLVTEHADNFKKYSRYIGSSFGKPYDYESLMHYSKEAFCLDCNKPTITPTDELAVIGQRIGLSHYDREEVNNLYKCKGTRRQIERNILRHDQNVMGKKKRAFLNSVLSLNP